MKYANKKNYSLENEDIKIALRVIEKEIEGLKSLKESLDETFSKVIDLVYNLNGRVVLSGMGKSGYIAQKISATMASTGTASFFVHPTEASHGDLGMITKHDAVILLSNTGETAELRDIIYYTKRLNVPLISIVRNKNSILAKSSDYAFILPNTTEANKVKAPTTSSTMMLAWGDCLSVALLERRKFDEEDFGKLHPGGSLGQQFTKVEDIMRTQEKIPLVKTGTLMSDAIIEMTEKTLGCTAVVDRDNNKLLGIITDGDLRRNMNENLLVKKVEDVMTKSPMTITKDILAVEAISKMQSVRKITCLFVLDKKKQVIGVVHLHHLISAGYS